MVGNGIGSRPDSPAWGQGGAGARRCGCGVAESGGAQGPPELGAGDAKADGAVELGVDEGLSVLALPHLAVARCAGQRRVGWDGSRKEMAGQKVLRRNVDWLVCGGKKART